MQSDPLIFFRDWFALWNHGTLATAVGSSDSHDVSRSIVGQGRTYVACDDTRADRLDVAEACRSFRAGRALVSLGLLTDLVVDDRYHVGDLATGLDAVLRVTVSVHGPSWTQADHVALYANGVVVRETAIEPSSVAGEKARVTWQIPRPAHDVALVAIASGPGVTGLYAATPRPYQPTSTDWNPRVAGERPTRFASTATAMVRSAARTHRQQPSSCAPATIRSDLLPALARHDEAGRRTGGRTLPGVGARCPGRRVRRATGKSPEPVRRGFAAYAATLVTPPDHE